MATDKIELEIVTPKGLALKASVDEVTAPSVNGEFGIMPGHLPVLVALHTGVVTYRIGNDSKKVAVGEGFAEGGPNKLLVLTEDFIDRDAVDPPTVRSQLAEVEAKLEKATQAADASDAEATRLLVIRENWLAAQLELIGDPPAPTMHPVADPEPEDEENAVIVEADGGSEPSA